MEDIYKNDFEKFLSHADEKEVLLEEILQDIRKYKIKSLLDIGAGNGSLSIPLSREVGSYLAVEPNEKFVVKLREAQLKVAEGKFPLEIFGFFDMVLASHSISYRRDLYVTFIGEAWKLVEPNGIFLIITYRGQEDDWTKLMKELGENHEDRNRVGFNQIVELLASLGEVKTRKVITRVKAKNLNDIVQALSFVASGGKPEKKDRFLEKAERLEKILKQKYQDNGEYSFPFQHFFITTQKL